MLCVSEKFTFPFNEFNKPPTIESDLPVKRFDIAPLALSGLEKAVPRNVLHQIRDRWHELESIRPDFFVGMTVFGSAVKGRFHQNSDIDLRLFINPDALDGKRLSPSDEFIIDSFFNPSIGGDSKIIAPSAYPVVLELNYEIIEEEVRSLAHKGEEEWQNFLGGLASPLLCMLFLSLGSFKGKNASTLQDMRAYMFTVLEQEDEAGQQVYARLIEELEATEEKKRGGKIYLPPTIEKARKYWRVDQ